MTNQKKDSQQEKANQEVLIKLRDIMRAIKGNKEDEEDLKKIRWTEEEGRDNESQIKS